ncbi:MAG: 50S ribosome-binding GTPase [Chloroflexi bacterium]|nr:50S ribosome-binding GTPase [Chloroflexota bacterium]MCI0728543.1 50S ribosome-binding GTPase [Chloroflexota bacterium]
MRFFHNEPEREDETWPGGDGRDRWVGGWPNLGWLEGLQSLWQWDELAAEIGQESRARVAIVGLQGSGKSLLFNRLRGWDIAGLETADQDVDSDGPAIELMVEPFGFFVLADLPAHLHSAPETGENIIFSLGDPALLVYLLDGAAGVRRADYRWVATLRASGKPLVVVLNKADLLPESPATAASAEQRLGVPVIPVSGLSGFNVFDRLLPALLDAAPRLAVPLARELSLLRRVAMRRIIRQVALFAGMMGAQPIPLLDLPFQAMLQVGMVMRVGAAYGRAPTGGINREILGTVISALGARFLATALVKLVPVLGWAVAGLISAASTVLMGEIAIRYYEGGGLGNFRFSIADFRLAARSRKQDPELPPSTELLDPSEGLEI